MFSKATNHKFTQKGIHPTSVEGKQITQPLNHRPRAQPRSDVNLEK